MEEETPTFRYHAVGSLGDCSSVDDEDSVFEQFLDTEDEPLSLYCNYAKLGPDLAKSPSIALSGIVSDNPGKILLVGENSSQKVQGGTSPSQNEDTIANEKQEDVLRRSKSQRLHDEGLNSMPEVEVIAIESSDSDRAGIEQDNGADRIEADVEYFSLELEEQALPVLEKHFQSRQTAKSLERTAPTWTPLQLGGISSIQSPFLQLHQEIVNFCEFIAPTQEEQQERIAAIQRVRDVVKSIWPDCNVMVFGSSSTGLFLPTSDADVVILDSGCEVPQSGLKALATSLRRRSMVKNMQVIGKARVPIVKFVEVESNISFDISFDVANGPSAAEFIKEAIAALPPLKPLCMILKMFLQQRELNEVYTGGLGSYALLVMLLTHLQMHPSRHNQNNFDRRNALEENLGVLLIDFLDLYGRALNVRDVGISCREGGRFFSKRSRGFVDTKRPYLLSVEDPQAPDNDIGKNSYNIQKVRSAFTLAHRLLTSASIVETSASPGILGRIVRLDSHLVGRKLFGPGKVLQFSDNKDQAEENYIEHVEGRWVGDEIPGEEEYDEGQIGPELSQRSRKRHRHRNRNESRGRAIEVRDKKRHRFSNFEEDSPSGDPASTKRKKQEKRKTSNIFTNLNKEPDDFLLNEHKGQLSNRTVANNQLSQSAAMFRKQKGRNGKGQPSFDRYSDLEGPEYVGIEAKASRKRKNDWAGNHNAAQNTFASSNNESQRTASDAFDWDSFDTFMSQNKGKDHASSSIIRRKEAYSEHATWPSKQQGWQGKHVHEELSKRVNFKSESVQFVERSISKGGHYPRLGKRKREFDADLSGRNFTPELRLSNHKNGPNLHTQRKKDKSRWEDHENEPSYHSRRVMKTPSHTKFKYF